MEPVLPEQATWRLCIGLAQGIALSALHHAAQTKGWPATNPELLAALMAVAVFVPTLAVSAIGNLRLRTMIVWAVAATAICGALAAYDIARDPVALFGMVHFARTQAGIGTMLALGTSLFIVHTLVVAGETDRRVFATYPTYFDVSWKHGVQFMLAALFVGVLWGLLFLGSGLFQLIHIDFFARLIRQPNFYFPVTSLATACALHVTDVRAGLVRGTRTLLLVLLSWLLPLMALIAAGFLMSLPFTGLAPLWGTRFGAKLLLTATAVLIVLINATHQDGRAEPKSASLLRHAAYVATVALAPLTVLAAIAVGLRVAQYGWTPSRIVAAACVAVAAVYACGYAIAAALSRPQMRPLEWTNLIASIMVVAVMLALHSPILDPARISVSDQVQRLLAGRVEPEHFDYGFLRFKAGRYGAEALDRLAHQTEGAHAEAIAARAAQAQALNYPSQPNVPLVKSTPQQLAANIAVIEPTGAALPEGFVDTDWSKVMQRYLLPRCLWANAKCEALLIDLDGDGSQEVVLFSQPIGPAGVFRHTDAEGWQFVGSLSNVYCAGVRDGLRAGRFAVERPRLNDLVVNGERLRLTTGCTPVSRPKAAAVMVAPDPR
jgi:hypothetical protein